MKDQLLKSLDSLLANTNDNIAVLANASAFIYEVLLDVNWVGFYINKNNALKLGPFQGRPACVDIKMGRGVCGTAALKKHTIIINDVTKIDNYIACHEETRSEIVVPIIINNYLYGVLDIDSLSTNRFTNEDRDLLEAFVNIIARYIIN